MALDRIDYDILSQLQRDARISNKDLAKRVGVSPSTCLERVRRLIDQRAIRGYHADVDPSVLGIGIQALVTIRLEQHAQLSFERLISELQQRPEVVTVFLLTGAQDLLIHVAVRDVPHLRDTLQALTSRSDTAHVETSLVFEFARNNTLPNYMLANDA